MILSSYEDSDKVHSSEKRIRELEQQVLIEKKNWEWRKVVCVEYYFDG